MATNYHHHQCYCLPTPPPTTTTCHCTMCFTTTHYPPPPPPPPPPDPLIHSISSHHHHQHHHIPPQIHQYPPPQNHHNHYPPPQTHQNHHFFQNYPHQENTQETPPPPLTPTVSSLIHRIAALESSLRRRNHSPQSPSLRAAAARTIQTHFRAFLVQRSVTLRHLKDLAFIKSTLNHLKSSVSNNTHFDSNTIYRESMSLLIKLDSIQGSDPMIRDGKRSINRELIRFMELIDEMCMEKQVISVKNVRFGKNNIKASNSRVFGYQELKFLENLKNQRKCINRVDESFDFENRRVSQIRKGDLGKSQGKSQPKVKKNVSFDDNGNVYRLFKSGHNSVLSDGSDSNNGDGEEVEVEEIGVSLKETEGEEDESSEMSENETDKRKDLRRRIYHIIKKNQPNQEDDDKDDNDDDEEDDSFVFSAPLPAKMEY